MLPKWVDTITSDQVSFFSPCVRCSSDSDVSRGPSRDLQANFFVLNARQRALTACSHCKGAVEAQGGVLLQIRRSSHHDVAKVRDLFKLCPTAVQGVQSYTINGQKVAFLRTRAVPKEARDVPKCITCSRGLQDNNIFCSLECKKVSVVEAGHSPSPPHSTCSASSGAPSTPAPAEWLSLKTNVSNLSNSSDEQCSPSKKRRKSTPRRSPFE